MAEPKTPQSDPSQLLGEGDASGGEKGASSDSPLAHALDRKGHRPSAEEKRSAENAASRDVASPDYGAPADSSPDGALSQEELRLEETDQDSDSR